MAILSKQNYGFARVEVEGLKGGKNGAKWGLRWSNPKYNQWNRFYWSKNHTRHTHHVYLSMQNYGITRGKRGL